MVDLADFRPNEGRQYPLADVVRLTYEDFNDANDATNRLQFGHIPSGSMVVAGSITVVTAFAGTNTTATIDVGDADTTDRYASGVDLTAAGRTALTLTGYLTSAPTDLLAEFGGDLSALTAGEILVEYQVVSENRAHENVVP
mgnify:CR=1 FL=1